MDASQAIAHGVRLLHMKTQKTQDIVALGEAMVEFNQTQAEPPLYLQGFGGDTSNAAIAAARAGAQVAYLTRLGTDRWGDRLMDLWQGENVDTQAVLRESQAPTGMYFVSHDAQGHHFSYARAGSAASRMQPADVPRWQAAIARSRWLHLSGISLAISASACDAAFAAMQLAHASGTLVAFDSNLRLSLWPLARAQACITHAIGLCDLFLPSLEDITALTGLTDPQSIIAWSHAQGAQQVVLKLGAEGALASDGQTQRQVPGLTVQAVDATGAGDCFAGNLLARLSKGDELWKATAYANAAAALSVQGYGAVTPLPRPDAAEKPKAMSTRPLIAVDWGTSSLRGARLDAAGQVLESRQFQRGIMTVAKGQFEAVFEACFGDWMQTPDALCLISGMAGSQQGWQEAPYCHCPAGFEELASALHWLQAGRMAIVPGLSCLHNDGLPLPQHDVMRGEEIQIFGALSLTGRRDATVVLPGTHSKWAQVEAGRVLGFRSFMTGEVFALLSQHSILSRTLPTDAPWDEGAFVQGVQLAQRTPSVLSSIFATRTLALFGSLPAVQHASFLSGLLIGEELRAMARPGSAVLLVGSAVLTQRYAAALLALGMDSQCLGDEATWAGHAALAKPWTHTA